jgi:hypothetical protein
MATMTREGRHSDDIGHEYGYQPLQQDELPPGLGCKIQYGLARYLPAGEITSMPHVDLRNYCCVEFE